MRNAFDASPAAALSFLTQQAAHIESEVYRLEYPQWKYDQLVPLDSSAPDWSKVVMFQAIDSRGELKVLGPNSTDIPTADIAARQGWHEIKTAALGYRYSLEEIGFAMLNNVSLDAERAQAVRDLTEQGMNRIYLLGHDDIGEGLYTSPNVSITASAGRLETLVAAGDAQGLLNVFGGLFNQIYITNTNTVHQPDTIVLPPSVLMLLSRSLLSSANASNYTVMQFLRENFPGMQWFDDVLLETAGANRSRRMLAYKRDMRVVKGHDVMPLQFMQPATADNVNFIVPALTRTGGTEWRIPAAAQYVDGI